jgi:hypothetical protein
VVDEMTPAAPRLPGFTAYLMIVCVSHPTIQALFGSRQVNTDDADDQTDDSADDFSRSYRGGCAQSDVVGSQRAHDDQNTDDQYNNPNGPFHLDSLRVNNNRMDL